MKTTLAILLLTLTSTTFAAEGTGVGVMLGNPTGLNAKRWLNESSAVDAGVGFSIGKHTNFSIHSDYLLHSEGALVFNDQHPLDLYYGLGGRMEFADEIELGFRIPVGVSHNVGEKNADIFGEIAPIIDIIGRKGLELHLVVGSRYYF